MTETNDHGKAVHRFKLFTNLRYVLVNGVRTNTFALLLEDTSGEPRGGPMFGPQRMLRGFGADPAWPVFDLVLKTTEYTGVDAESHGIRHISGKPLLTGQVLHFADGLEVHLMAEDSDRPIEVQSFEGRAVEQPILKVWAVLTTQVAKYWIAPHMPGLEFGPPERIARVARERERILHGSV